MTLTLTVLDMANGDRPFLAVGDRADTGGIDATRSEVILGVGGATGTERVAKLRELSPLWDMYKDGVDLSTIQWAAH